MTRAAALALALLLRAEAGAAQTAIAAPPALVAWRYDEDWSALRDPAARRGLWWEPVKYVPLDATGERYLSAGLELRARYEGTGNPEWGAAPDDSYRWYRAMPHVDLRAGRVRAFGQLAFAWADGVRGGPGPVDETGADLLQGFVDLDLEAAGAMVTLRGGRQLLSYGSERIVGIRYGPNVLQPFDAARAIVRAGAWRVDLLFARPVRTGPGDFNDRTDRERALWGAYAARPAADGRMGVDAYYVGYENRAARFAQGAGRELRHTLGARSYGARGRMGWNWEGFYQFGEFDGAAIAAWSLASETSRAWPAAPLAPKLTLRANVASGDRDRTRRGLQTFNPLFPKGRYFGELSPLGPFNLVNVQAVADFELGGGVTLNIGGASYWRESRGDGVYGLGGQLLRDAAGSRARHVGVSVETSAGWTPAPGLELVATAAVFAPGRFVRDTGRARPIRFMAAEALYRF